MKIAPHEYIQIDNHKIRFDQVLSSQMIKKDGQFSILLKFANGESLSTADTSISYPSALAFHVWLPAHRLEIEQGSTAKAELPAPDAPSECDRHQAMRKAVDEVNRVWDTLY